MLLPGIECVVGVCCIMPSIRAAVRLRALTYAAMAPIIASIATRIILCSKSSWRWLMSRPRLNVLKTFLSKNYSKIENIAKQLLIDGIIKLGDFVEAGGFWG